MANLRLLFICRKQFGYSIDNYYHCKYLKDTYDITYFSPDTGLDKIAMEGANINYIVFTRNRIFNNIKFYWKACEKIKAGHYNIIILNRSYFFFIFKVFNPGKKFIYDIRSGVVNSSFFKRIVYTQLIKLDLMFFKNVTIISNSLAKQLKIRNYVLLPLGAERLKIPDKEFDNLSLVYVGSFNNRRIEDTIEGLWLYLNEYGRDHDISYHIYGFGDHDSEARISDAIVKYKLQDQVFFHGRINHQDLVVVLGKSNVGVSYLPLTPYFDVQPPTKTFEYLLAGMPVIATKTKEHQQIINENNGVLVSDNSYDFMRGLEVLYNKSKSNHFSSKEIISESIDYSWENIVRNNLQTYIEKLVKKVDVAHNQ